MRFLVPAPKTRVGVLRRRVHAHNGRVLAVCFFAVVGGVGLWVAGYVVCYWLTLLFLSAVFGGEARMPAQFDRVFGMAAAAVFVGAWVERWLLPHPRVRDKARPVRVALDFVFMPARLLFSLRDNMRAWLRVREAELPVAIEFIDRVRAARRFPLHAAPVELPEEEMRERILTALLHLEIVEMRREGGTTWLRYVAPARSVESRVAGVA